MTNIVLYVNKILGFPGNSTARCTLSDYKKYLGDVQAQDMLVETYLHARLGDGDPGMADAVERMVADIPTPKWKLWVAWVCGMILPGLYLWIHILGYSLVQQGIAEMSPILWAIDVLVLATMVCVSLLIKMTYQGHKSSIEHLINGYISRNPDSTLIQRYYGSFKRRPSYLRRLK